jgi:23S rRNA G2445 N2-methylase RlmL
VIAVYQLLSFDIPRPKALLGHQHFHSVLASIDQIISLTDRANYNSIYINAAGSDSSVMLRLKEALSQELSLNSAEDEGDLLLRIRRTPKSKRGWDVLIRLTPRPLATREWRVCNFPGALNASVAHALVRMTKPTLQDIFLNIACGSGTIMIERAEYLPAKQIIGCDIDLKALGCARANVMISGKDNIKLTQGDGTCLALADASVDALCADLPFGQLSGSHKDNKILYPAILKETARVAKTGATFAIITHELRLMERVLQENKNWLIKNQHMVTLTGLHPRIFILERL